MQNFKSKITAIFLILAGGVLGAYLVISNIAVGSHPEIDSKNNNSLDQLQQDGSGVFAENTDSANTFTSDNIGADQNNLTQVFATSFFNQVQASGIAGGDSQSLNQNKDSINKNVLSDVLDAAPKLKTVADIKDSDLKISYDNSTDAKMKYFKTFGESVKKYFPDGNNVNYYQIVIDVYGKNNYQSAGRLNESYKKLVSDLMKLDVPSDLSDLHKEIIVYYKNAEITYGAMSGYGEDPIKGYAALEMGNKLLNDGAQLQKDLIEIIKKTFSK